MATATLARSKSVPYYDLNNDDPPIEELYDRLSDFIIHTAVESQPPPTADSASASAAKHGHQTRSSKPPLILNLGQAFRADIDQVISWRTRLNYYAEILAQEKQI